ncbi:hypothetical protein HZH66_002364 [Vespula vulgaris]|uniref:Uncharacterized protein n=1 Tax=Vespula vulgaris TaxID=7454 RepID=A0A834KJS9_VESVU|nr:hypothetical protein HZH66_002364 [Vespula vulgaris]
MNSNKLILRTTTWKGLEGRLNRRRLTLSLRSFDDDDDDDDEDEDEDEDEDDNDDDEYSQIVDIGEAKRLLVGGRNGNGGA